MKKTIAFLAAVSIFLANRGSFAEEINALKETRPCVASTGSDIVRTPVTSGELPAREKMLIRFVLQNEFTKDLGHQLEGRNDLAEKLQNSSFTQALENVSRTDDATLQRAMILELGKPGLGGYDPVKVRETIKRAMKAESDKWVKLEMARVLASLGDDAGKNVLVSALVGREGYMTQSEIEVGKAVLPLLLLDYDFPGGFPKTVIVNYEWGGIHEYFDAIRKERAKLPVEDVRSLPLSSAPVAQTDAVVQGNNAFALALYAKLRAENQDNLFLSPYSISAALAMTYAGAKGKTAAEMAEVLHFTVPQEQLHPAFAALAAKLHGDIKKEGYQLRIANRLWGQAGYRFLPPFLQMTRDHYGAELAQVDFAQNTEAVRHTINTWVEEKTEKKIKDLIPARVLDPSTTLVLTNAVYFQGDWQRKFEAKATKDAPFRLTPQEKVAVPMMRQTDNFAYGVVGEVQVLELPYVGKDLSMFVLLPKEVDGLADLEKSLSVENLHAWTSGLREQKVEVLLPKFKLNSSFQLEKVLGSMGMPLAFSDEADFSGMTGKQELLISTVIHKAFVDVYEEGTEAAAATAVVMPRNGHGHNHPTFRADHPFLFLIRDNRTGSILFLGRMANPK